MKKHHFFLFSLADRASVHSNNSQLISLGVKGSIFYGENGGGGGDACRPSRSVNGINLRVHDHTALL